MVLLKKREKKIYVAVLRRRHIVDDEGMKMSMNGGYEFPGCGRVTWMYHDNEIDIGITLKICYFS